MNFAESPEDKLTIELSEPQWQLLQKARSRIDKDLARCISVAVKRNNLYELYLTEDDVEDLADFLEEQVYSARSEKQKNAYFELLSYLVDFLDDQEEGLFQPLVDNQSQMTGSVYVIRVELADDKKIWRRIAIRGGQTLHDLHNAIFEAFDREEEHLYSFFIPPTPSKSKNINVFRDSPEFTHPYALEDSPVTMLLGMFDPSGLPRNAASTAIQTLDLGKGHRMFYIFDFGDSWEHWLTVEQTDGQADEGPYPRILEQHGDSPPQYWYGEEMDEQEDADEWDEDL